MHHQLITAHEQAVKRAAEAEPQHPPCKIPEPQLISASASIHTHTHTHTDTRQTWQPGRACTAD
eukprot:1159227-Pelagomonas_calceolata.AAC.15